MLEFSATFSVSMADKTSGVDARSGGGGLRYSSRGYCVKRFANARCPGVAKTVRSLRESVGIEKPLVVAGHAADESCVMVVHRALDQVDKD